jgi:MFS family permease
MTDPAEQPTRRRVLGEPLAAWVTLLGGVLAVWGYSAASYTIPVLMRDIVEETGWGRGEFAAATATRTLTIAVTGLLWGAATDRIGARAVLVTGGLLCAAGLVGFGAMQSLGAAAAVGLVMGTGMGALGLAPASTLVARRFGPRRGIALGLLHGCDNLLNSVVPGAAAALLVAYGWRPTARVFAAAYAAVALVLLVCVRPGEGRSAARAGGRAARAGASPWRCPEFHLAALVFLAAYGTAGVVIFHFVAYQRDLGISLADASAHLGELVRAGFLGSIAVGLVAPRLGAAHTLLIAHLVTVVASVVPWLNPTPEALRRWAWVHGFAQAGYAPLAALVLADLFGADAPRLGALVGAVVMGATLGAYVGNVAAGWTHDAWGTYAPAWQAATAILAAATIPLALLVRRARVAHAA